MSDLRQGELDADTAEAWSHAEAASVMNHPTLFDQPRVRASDPETSKRAAGKVWSGLADLVVENLALHGSATDDELCLRLNVIPRRWPSLKTARSRVTHAEDPAKRLIVDTGLVRDGMTIWAHRDHVGWVENVDTRGRT